MATLLMVESWMHSTGLRLPPLITAMEHRYVLFTRDPALYPDSLDGTAHPVIAAADDVVVVDTNDVATVVQAAHDLARRRAINGVLTTCDYYLDVVAEIAGHLGLPGADAKAVRCARYKHEVRDATCRAGLPGPRFGAAASWEEAHDIATDIGFPVVAKPVDLNAGTSVQLVPDEAALKEAFWDVTGGASNTRGQPRPRLLLIEEWLRGPEVSVEAVGRDGETTVVGITGKHRRGFVEVGHQFPAGLDPAVGAEVAAYVRAALEAIGYTHGLSHAEVRLTAGGPRLVEINPRQGGGYIFDLVRLVTGTDPLEVLVDLALGRSPRIGTTATPLSAQTPAAAVSFVVPPRAGSVASVDGVASLDADAAVRRWELATPAAVGVPEDNNTRIGHVLTLGRTGAEAYARAAAAVGSLRLHMDDGDTIAPLSAG